MIKKIYIETSVIGAYFDERNDVVSAAQRYWTRIWWDNLQNNYEAVVSQAVKDELSHPDYPNSEHSLEFIKDITNISIEPEIRQIVKIYIRNKLMPKDPLGDALHLALASYHKCDYLLTWNCKHIANPNKFNHIRLLNISLGLYVPFLVTPNQLIGDDYD